MIRKFATVALSATLLLAPATAASAKQGPPRTPCEQEDSTFCVWDAKRMGNGEGKSFKVSRKGKVTYITHFRAMRLIENVPMQDPPTGEVCSRPSDSTGQGGCS